MADSPCELTDLQHVRDAAVLALETAEARAALRLLDSSDSQIFLESWGDFVDPLEYLKDEPSFARGVLSISRVDDRAGGRYRPVIENEHDLAVIRGTGRLLSETVPAAIGVLKNLTNFCVGTGFSYEATARDGANCPPALVAAVQQVVDEFLDENDWVGDFERELFLRSRRDGECFLALYPQPGGHVQARVIEPEQVTEPQDSRGIEDWLGTEIASSWTFGIHTDADDVQSVHGYHVRWNETASDWDYLPAATVEHVKLNVDRNIKRGLSDFYAVRSHLEGAEKLLRNTREGAAVQAAIAFIREHIPGTSDSQIQNLSRTSAVGSYTQSTKTGSRTRFVSRYEPGTVLDVASGMQYKPGPLGSAHAPNFIAIEQAVLRTVGTRWCMPEYMVSGDASNANYSSSMVAESPFVKACQSEQRFYVSRFRRIVWKVIQAALAAGRLARWTGDLATLQQLVAVQIHAPEVAVRDTKSEAETAEIEYRNGILSRRTWASQAGRDYDVEQNYRQAEGPNAPLTTELSPKFQ